MTHATLEDIALYNVIKQNETVQSRKAKYFHEALRGVNNIETESETMVMGLRGRTPESCRSIGSVVQCSRMRRSWGWMLAMLHNNMTAFKNTGHLLQVMCEPE